MQSLSNSIKCGRGHKDCDINVIIFVSYTILIYKSAAMTCSGATSNESAPSGICESTTLAADNELVDVLSLASGTKRFVQLFLDVGQPTRWA